MIRKINNTGSKINLTKGCGWDMCDTDNSDCGGWSIDNCSVDNCNDCSNDEPIKCPRLDIVH